MHFVSLYIQRILRFVRADATPLFQGVRVSDPATVDVAEMVLCGSINKGIASSIKQAGGRALGISGKDDNLLVAKKLRKNITDEESGKTKVMAGPGATLGTSTRRVCLLVGCASVMFCCSPALR